MADPAIVKFLAALEETQYLTPDRMEAYQRRLLDRLLRHARAETAFYADRLAPVFRADDSIDWDRWTEIPILTRAEAQENAEALRAKSLPPAAGKSHEGATSGSTGRVLLHATNDLQHIASACANERLFAWHGLDPAALTASIRNTSETELAYPDGQHSSGWRIVHPESRLVSLSISTPIHLQLEWLRRVAPAIVFTYPSSLREIGRIAEQDGRPLTVDALLTTGEMIPPDTRAELIQHFGHAPIDQYGSAEIGHMSGSCPHSDKHHIASELALIEIVDADGVRAAEGIDGRIVATSLYNYAMPFIRYDTGDLGTLSAEPCGCGRTLPAFGRISGRAQMIFRFVDGTRLSPMSLHVREFDRFIPNRQCQLVQTAIDRVELRYIPRSPDQENDVDGFKTHMKESLHPSLAVGIVKMETIERSPSGKFEDCISLIN